MRSRTGNDELYGAPTDLALAVSPDTGHRLYPAARSSGARHIVAFGTAFGTAFGLSTLYLAAAPRDNGGGRQTSREFAALHDPARPRPF